MRLTFYGAARQVTGSMFLLELQDEYKILIDCGIDFESNQTSVIFPFDPASVDLVLLTHAHLDHSGKIPNLYQAGYDGQILCTSATFDLTRLILSDSVAIQSKNIKRRLRRKKFGARKVSDEELLDQYLEEAEDRFVTLAFNKRFEIRSDIAVTFIPAGHLLGASHILLEVLDGDKWVKIGFSGDIGRMNYPLLQDPEKMPQVDYLICETTYGNRVHQESANPEELLFELINKACVDIPGRMIIPSFSVGRTQALLYTLNKLAREGRLPAVKVFADSPMAGACTEIYQNHFSLLNDEAKEFYQHNHSLFDFENLITVSGNRGSKAISSYMEPCIILSSSGMIRGGRIQEHVRKNLSNQYCSILLVGHCAEGTIGHSLFTGEKTITIKGHNIPVNANVIYTDVFSGHGDQNDLIRFVESQNPEEIQTIFLVHGEEQSMTDFSGKLSERGYRQVEMPEQGAVYELY